ncbi:MAG: hypothetical protein ACMXX8_02995 [Candidatus Woesearchaeota archaeon]
MNTYPEVLQHYINVMKIPVEFSKTAVVGTGSSKITSMFSDIDMMTQIKSPMNRHESVLFFENQIKNMVHRILQTRLMYYSDFKCGEYEGHGIHWTADEVLNGIHKKTGLTLYDAMNMVSITKLDAIVPFEGKLIEMTNFFVLYYHNDTPLNSNELTTDAYLKSLEKDIIHYTQEEKNIFKAMKRLYSYLKVSGTADDNEINLITNLLNSNANLLSLTNGILETINLIINSQYLTNTIPQDHVLNSLETAIFNINSSGNILSSELINEITTTLENVKNNIVDNVDLLEASNNLKEIMKIIKKIISDYTEQKMREENVNFPELKGGASPEEIIRNRMIRNMRQYQLLQKELKGKKRDDDKDKEKEKLESLVGTDSMIRQKLREHFSNRLNTIVKEWRRRRGLTTAEPLIDGFELDTLTGIFDKHEVGRRGLDALIKKKTGLFLPQIKTSDLMKFTEKALDNIERNLNNIPLITDDVRPRISIAKDFQYKEDPDRDWEIPTAEERAELLGDEETLRREIEHYEELIDQERGQWDEDIDEEQIEEYEDAIHERRQFLERLRRRGSGKKAKKAKKARKYIMKH